MPQTRQGSITSALRHMSRVGVNRAYSQVIGPSVYNRFGMPYNNPIRDGDRPKRDSGGLATLVQAEKMMQIAMLLPSAAFVGWLIGVWLDKMMHQKWVGIAGIVFGGISGLVYVIRLVMSTNPDDKSGKGNSQL